MLIMVCAGSAAGVKRDLQPVELKSMEEGLYVVSREGEPTGESRFQVKTFSNNTIVYESSYDITYQGGFAVTGSYRLTVEEDTRFPVFYETRREMRKGEETHVIEAEAEMFANVVVTRLKRNDREERKVLPLPTGCMFLEDEMVCLLPLVVFRYGQTTGGEQSLDIFDPLYGSQDQIVVKRIAGPADASGGAEGADSRMRYSLQRGKNPPINFDVDGSAIIVRVTGGFQNLEYLLAGDN
jgi:hypothetical protein